MQKQTGRSLKFRAWWRGKMICFSLANLAIAGEGSYYYLDGQAPIMQFTGLTDRNKQEIYEGDIVRSDRGLFEVFWRDGFAGFYLRKGEWIDLISMTGNVTWCEIVGNIYEHPHLLQEMQS